MVCVWIYFAPFISSSGHSYEKTILNLNVEAALKIDKPTDVSLLQWLSFVLFHLHGGKCRLIHSLGSGHDPRLPEVWRGFDPRLVRGLWLVDLDVTPTVFLPFSSLRKKSQFSRHLWAY